MNKWQALVQIVESFNNRDSSSALLGFSWVLWNEERPLAVLIKNRPSPSNTCRHQDQRHPVSCPTIAK